MGIIYEKLEQAYNLESGVCLIAAPTGAGKTHSVKELAFNKISKHIKSSKAQKDDKNKSGQLSLFESPFDFELADEEYTETNCPTIVYLADKKNSVSEVYTETTKKIGEAYPKDKKKILICKSKEDLTEMLIKTFSNSKKKKNRLLSLLFESVKFQFESLTESFNKYKNIENHESDIQEKRRETFDKDFNVLSKSITKWIKEQIEKDKEKESSEVSEYDLVEFVNSHKEFEWCRSLYPLSFIKEYEMITMTYKMFFRKARGFFNGDVWADFFLKTNSSQNPENENPENEEEKATRKTEYCFILDEIEAFKKISREEFIDKAVNSSINSFNAIGTIYSVININIPFDINSNNPNYQKSIEQLKEIIDKYFHDWDFRNKLVRANEDITNELSNNNTLLTFYNDGVRQISSGLKRHELFFVNLEDAIYLCHKKDLPFYLHDPKINHINVQELITNIERIINFFCKSTVPEGALAVSGHKDVFKGDKENYCNTFRANGENNELKNYILNTPEKPKNMRTSGWETTFNKNFYNSGFEYLLINQNEGGNVEMQRFDMQITPEEILVQLATIYPVVLMSATSLLPHHNNVNLEYIKNNISNFLDWNEEDTNKIETELNYNKQVQNIDVAFNKTVADYDLCRKSGDKKAFIHNNSKAFFREKEPLLLNEMQLNALSEKISSCLIGNESNKRTTINEENISLIINHLDFLKHYYFFRKEQIKSGVLFFNPKLLEDICKNLAKILDETFGFQESFVTTIFASDLNENDKKNNSDKETNSKIKKFKECYKNGTDCFVVTTYASLAKGVNFTFDIQENEDVIHVAQEGRPHSTDRSFQAVAFGNITNLFSNSENNENKGYRNSIKNTFEKLYDFNEMYMRGAISPKEYDELIDHCFKKNNRLTLQTMTRLNKKTKEFNQEVYNDKAMDATHYLYQACGRLFRTTALSTKMAISMTSANYDFFESTANFKEAQCMPKNVVMEHLTKTVLSEKDNIQDSKFVTNFENNSSKNIFKNRMAQGATKLEIIIKKLLKTIVSGNNNNDEINNYELIRDTILENGLLINREKFNELTNKKTVGNLFKSIYVKMEEGIDFQNYYFTDKTRLDNNEDPYKWNNEYDVSLFPKSNYTEVNLNKRFEKEFLEFKTFEKHLKDKGIDYFNESSGKESYILNPYAYMSIFKGILGEEFFNHLCKVEHLPFQAIKEPELYERADFISLCASAAVDVKSYKNDNADLTSVIDKIIEYKADVLNVTKYYVVNVHPAKNNHYKPRTKAVKTKEGRDVEVIILQLVKKDEVANGEYQYFYIDENIQELKKGLEHEQNH